MRRALLLTVAAGMWLPAVHAAVTDQMIENAATDTKEVLTWGMSPDGQRYSRLSQVNTQTVKNLVPVWSFSFGGEKQRGQESQPLVHNGKMFVTASYSRIFALDAKTGTKLWKYEHRLPEGIMPCCDVVNRGAALYDNLVIFGTLDAQLVALDQNTGKVVWKEKIDDYQAGYSSTAAPIVVHGLVLTGVSGGEFGVVGRVEARDAKTGRLVWTRPTVEGHMGYKYDGDGKAIENGISGTTNQTWPGDLWKTGGAATWLGGSYDPKTGLVYFGTGNPGPWNSHLRPGDNLFSSSTLAIDPKTGQIVWHYQTTPHDGWDYDGVNEFVTFDMNGKRMGGKADRNGFFYVLDRRNGHFIRGAPYAKQTWATGLSGAGRPLRVANSDPTPEGVYLYPSVSGATNWWPSAYSPTAQLYYANVLEQGGLFFDSSSPPRVERGRMYTGGAARIAEGEPAAAYVRAIDPLTSQVRWERRNLTETDAPRGGLLATAGGLLFGSDGPRLYALDAATGKELWSFATGGQISAPPMSYRAGDSQVIAVLAGQDLFTFSLPAAGDRPHAGTAVVLAGRPANPHQPLIRPITFQ